MNDSLLPRGGDDASISWQAMGAGAPTIIALAQLCGRATLREAAPDAAELLESLPLEAHAILHAAATRGVIELKSNNLAFDAVERFLAVHVEQAPQQWRVFRAAGDPQQTIRFLDGFRQLCAAGLAMHHLYADFSLTPTGFDIAATVKAAKVQPLLELTSSVDFDD